jgi:hypothetical protein
MTGPADSSPGERLQEECLHPRDQWRYVSTYSDWFDGDEDDIYECRLCGKRIVEYVPR